MEILKREEKKKEKGRKKREKKGKKGGRGEGRGSGTTLFQRAMTRRGSHVNYPLRRDETFRVVHGLRDKEVRLC